MRSDALGMFWEDIAETRTRGQIIRPMPPIPDTGWTPPTYFPDLSAARVISLDCETYDPELLENGPGWARGKGHLVGVSLGVPGGGKWYFPMRHEIEPESNLDPEKVLSWLRVTLSNPHQPKIGANLIYDLGWLKQEGVEVLGELVDVQYAEALLDEGSKVSLEILGQKYLDEGKESSLMYKWCADFYGGAATSDQRKNIYRCPPRLVGPYAESDADLPLRIIVKQYPLLIKEGLLDLFRMECELNRLLIPMRYAGVSVNVAKAEELRVTLAAKEKEEHAKLKAILGFDIDTNSAESVARGLANFGVLCNKTAKGKPSVTKAWLESLNNPVANGVKEIRKLAKLRGTFVESYVLDSHVNGKVYGQFHLLRGDSSGTRSGRFSSSTPNLQNLPSRDDELAPLVRGLFIPDEGHLCWRKYDYSQIEYRFFAHFAVGDGSDAIRKIYNEDPKTDYHEITRKLIHAKTGKMLDRKPTKNINFGLLYGMGVEHLAESLGLTVKAAKELFAAYHEGVPFAKKTIKQCSEEAATTGIIRTILGRKSRFDLWEPLSYGEERPALPYRAAILEYGQVRRAYTHKALNRKLQGSAADLIKKAILICHKSGVFDATGVPRLTVHDELDFSDPGGKDEAFNEMRHILETAIPLNVPIIADCDIGPDWGHCK